MDTPKSQIELLNQTVAFIRAGLTEEKWDKRAAFSLQADIVANIARIEYAYIALPNGIRVPGSVANEIQSFLRNKERIRAIKSLRTETGIGLREAMECVDEYAKTIH